MEQHRDGWPKKGNAGRSCCIEHRQEKGRMATRTHARARFLALQRGSTGAAV
jgi:hypothetical protein